MVAAPMLARVTGRALVTSWLALYCLSCRGAARVESAAPVAVTTGSAAVPPVRWQSNQGAWLERTLVDHPLVGALYSPPRGGFACAADLADALGRARFVLLGEKHDNRDHHRLEALVLAEILPTRRDMAVAFEMLDVGQQDPIDRYLAAHPSEVDGLAAAVDWDRSGWPAWSMYRPVFLAAVEGHARIVAANLSRDRARAMAQGEERLDPAELPWLPPAELAALDRELRESHCGLLPEAKLPTFSLIQRARDWTMAQRMRASDHGSGVALCAGVEHVRKDRGVAAILGAFPGPAIVSLAFLEVERGVLDPARYWDTAGATPPFDFVAFTPRVDERDPCQAMRERGRP